MVEQVSRFCTRRQRPALQKTSILRESFFSQADPKQIDYLDLFRQYNLKLSCLYGKEIVRAVSPHT